MGIRLLFGHKLIKPVFFYLVPANLQRLFLLNFLTGKNFNSTGAVATMVIGLISCLILGAMGSNVWSPVEGAAIFVGNPLVPLAVPAIITIPLGFIAGYLGSVLSTNKVSQEEAERVYKEIRVKANTVVSVSDISH